MNPLIFIAALVVAIPQKLPPESKQFDFWIGEWECSGEMFGTDGKATKTAGKNSIRRTFDGHVVQESFEMDGFKGGSYSVFDPNAKLWRQTWVDNSGGYIALTGEFKEGKMTLTTIPRPKAPNMANRMVFHNIKADSFDWDWEATSDSGKTWKLNWRLHYKRAKQ